MPIKKPASVVATIIATLCISTLCPCLALAHTETLVIYNWAEYLSEKTVAKFEAQTGHNIRQIYYDNEGDRDRTIISGEKANYDLIMFDKHSLDIFAANGLLQDLSKLPIEGIKNQDEEFRNACGKQGMPYGWGTTGIAYRDSIINHKVISWQSLLKPPAEAHKRIVMPLDEVDTTSMLLLSLGEETNSANIETLQSALELLKSQMPHISHYGYGLTHAELKGNDSEMAMTMAYNSDIQPLIELTGQSDWKYVVPEEGGDLWLDCWAIPEGEAPSQVAIDFLGFLNDPKNAAENAEDISFASTNIKARTYFSSEYLKNSIINPEPEVLARSKPTPMLSTEAIKLRNWLVFSAKNHFEAAQEQP